MHDWGTGWWIAMTIGMLVFWALLTVTVVWTIRKVGRDHPPEEPLDRLKRRLAEGQISADEYERRRALLQER